MELIDTHCHLTFEGLVEQVDAVLERARDAHVRRCITIGTTPEDGEQCVKLAETHEGVFAAAGIHPHEANKFAGADLSNLSELYHHPKLVAAGEMGLDYHYDFADRKAQWRVFEAQLAECTGADLPLVIHNREATRDAVRILADMGYAGERVVFHCFTGNPDEARLIRDNGWRISFTGIITFKNSGELSRIARDYPAEELMIETDSPYLSPVPVRHVRPNEPAHVAHIAEYLANIRGVSVDEIAEMTTQNALDFFDLDRKSKSSSR